MNIPRLRKGQGIKGPEPVGCFNTGTAPVLFHTILGRWLVGPELAVDGARRAILFDRYKHKRTLQFDGRTVHIFSTRAPAVARFQAILAVRTAERAADVARIRAAHADIISGDPERVARGAVALADY